MYIFHLRCKGEKSRDNKPEGRGPVETSSLLMEGEGDVQNLVKTHHVINGRSLSLEHVNRMSWVLARLIVLVSSFEFISTGWLI